MNKVHILVTTKLLGNIDDKRFSQLRLMLTFRGPLSFIFMHRAQTAEDINTISFAYDGTTAPCLS